MLTIFIWSTRSARALLTVALIAFSIQASPQDTNDIAKEMYSDLAAMGLEDGERCNDVFKMLDSVQSGSGLPPVRMCPVYVGKMKFSVPNVVAVVPGEIDSIIVVGAHLDKKGAGAGSLDDGSGCVILKQLYRSVKHSKQREPQKFRHTYHFVAFSYEEHKLKGSKSFVREMKDIGQLSRIAAMVNLEMLGGAGKDLFIWKDRVDPDLESIAISAAGAGGFCVTSTEVDGGYLTDSFSFSNAKIPAITFFGFQPAKINGTIHTKNDQLSLISESALFEAFKFLEFYLEALEKHLEQAPGDGELR